MLRCFGSARTFLLAGILVALVAVVGTAQPPAPKDKAGQDPTKLRVSFQSVDFVDLDGTYYRSAKAGRDAPCVLLLHKFGSDRSKSGWDELARALQLEGFAVLTFDFRGQGGSTNVSPTFWTVPVNRNGIFRSNPKNTSIEFKNFRPNYGPWLVHDILSARRFLESKNDAGELNVSNLFIVGAQEGAAVGLEFLAAEWQRQYVIGFKALQSSGTPKIAGKDIAGAVWLSLPLRPAQPTPGFTLPITNWVRTISGLREENPMCLIFGEKDGDAKRDAEEVFRTLSHTQTGGRQKHKLDALIPVKGTELSGQALLGPAADALGVKQTIVNYIKKVAADRRAIAWSEVEVGSNPLQLYDLRRLGVSLP